MCIKHVGIINKVAWNIRNYRYVGDVSGLQEQRFVEQQQVSLKWITQGLSNSGRKRSKISLSSNPAITMQEVSCVPNTPNTLVRCISALVRQRDSEIQAV